MIGLEVPKGGEVRAVALAADGSRLAALAGDGVRVCDPAGGAWWPERCGSGGCMALHPAGRYVAEGAQRGEVCVADLISGERTELASALPVEAGRASIGFVLFSPDGGELWAVSTEVWRWAVGSWQPLPPAVPHVSAGNLCLAADGTTVATWETVWPDGTRESVRTTFTFAAAGVALVAVVLPARGPRIGAFDPTGRLFAAPDSTNALTVWAVATGQEQFHRPARRAALINALAFTPDGGTLLVGQGTGVCGFDTATWAEGPAYDWRAGRVSCLAVAADGLTAAAGTKTGRVVVWDLGG